MTPELTMVNFEKWDYILKQPDVEARFHYASLIQQFARGMAYANTNKINLANASLATLGSMMNEKRLAVVLTPFNAPITAARIAKYILLGTIASKENDAGAAIEYFKMAVDTEDSLVYNEPRDWLVPARHFLGIALYNSKRFKEAEKVFRYDLEVQPNNFMAVKKLQATLLKQKNVKK